MAACRSVEASFYKVFVILWFNVVITGDKYLFVFFLAGFDVLSIVCWRRTFCYFFVLLSWI